MNNDMDEDIKNAEPFFFEPSEKDDGENSILQIDSSTTKKEKADKKVGGQKFSKWSKSQKGNAGKRRGKKRKFKELDKTTMGLKLKNLVGRKRGR